MALPRAAAALLAACAQLVAALPTCSLQDQLALFQSRVVDTSHALEADGVELPPEELPVPGLRLYMVTVTGQGNWDRKAMAVEPLIMQRAGPHDRIAYVCRTECAKTGRSQGKSMIELPDFIKTSNGTYAVDKCFRYKEGRNCTGYHLSSLKYVYGLVAEVRRFLASGVSPMPKYWLVKDDDTYVHIPNLIRALEDNHGDPPIDPLVQRLSWQAEGGCNICGGAGWVLSGALAIELATTYGDRYIDFQVEKMENGTNFYYDTHVPKVVRWVPDSKAIRLWEMNPFSVLDKKLCLDRPDAWLDGCHHTVECDCARTRRPATWHMSIDFNRSLEKLSLIP